MESSLRQSMPLLQGINDAADIKKIFSIYLEQVPADERLEMAMSLINAERGKAIDTLNAI